MTRLPFPLLAAGLTLLAAWLATLARPGQPRVAAGVAVGVGVAGAFTSAAVLWFARIRRQEKGPEVAARLMKAFVGLMTARMIGYLALVMGTVVLSAGDAVHVGVGLVGGTLVFQALEVLYLRMQT